MIPRLVFIEDFMAVDFVKEYPDYQHIDPCMYFTNNGDYVFDETKHTEAFDWCGEQVTTALENGGNVVLTNFLHPDFDGLAHIQYCEDNNLDFLVIHDHSQPE